MCVKSYIFLHGGFTVWSKLHVFGEQVRTDINCEDDLESILLFLFYLAKQKKRILTEE